MRIRGAKTELEEAGLETDGMVESTAKLRSEILALTGVDIMDGANEFKSTYKIMDELAVKWKDLTDIQQATVTELIAGKRQGNIVSSLMANFDTAREALDTSMNSAGSAMKEHEKWQQSLEAQINKLKAAWQGLSQAFLSSDFLHGALDAVIKLVDGITALIDKIGVLPTLLGVLAGYKGITKWLPAIFKTISATGGISGIKSLKDVIAALGLTFPGAAKGATTFGKAIKAMFTAMTAHPIILVIAALVAVFTYQSKKAEELAEKVDELTESYKTNHDELKKLQKDYDTSNESSMISKYAKLSKGVDGLGRNVSLTADEYSEYQSIVSQIADQIPSLVSGYDEQGNAILSVKGNVEQLTAAYEKLIHAQNQKILASSSGDIEKDWQNTLKQANGYDFLEWFGNAWSLGWLFGSDNFKVFDMKTDTAEWLSGLTSDTSLKDIKEGLGSWDSTRRMEVIQALQNAGYDVNAYSDISKVLEEELDKEPEKIKAILDNYYASFDDAIAEYKTKATALLSEAFDISSSISGLNYGNISEELQSIAYQTVNSLDFDFLNDLTEQGKTIDQWTKELLNQLNAVGKVHGKTIEDAFELQTQFNGGDINYGDYVDKLREVEKIIDGLNLKDEAKTQLKISLGLDDEGVVDQYDALIKRLTTGAENSLGLDATAVKKFIDDLSAEEFSILTKIVPNLEAGTTLDEIQSLIDDKLATEFKFDIKVQTEGIEALNTALAESRSAAGMTAESIEFLKARYEDLDGFNAAALFEKTANGIRLNSDELSRLEEQYIATNKLEIDKNLNTLVEKYQDVTEQIKNCTDAQKKEELQASADYYKDKIDELSTLASQYDGLTSAFTKWQNALNGAEEGDNYDSVFENLEAMKELDDKKLYGTDKYKTFAQLMSYNDLSSASIDEIGKAFDKGYKKAERYFTENKKGSKNFLNDLNKINSEWAHINKNGDWEVNINAEEAAKKLGISVEAVLLLLDKLKDYGIKVEVDDTSVSGLQTKIQQTEAKLKELGQSPVDINVDIEASSSNLGKIESEIEKAKSKIAEINKSSVSPEVKTAQLEDARAKLESLIQKKQEASQPAFMNLNTSQVNASLVDALDKIKEYQNALNELNKLQELKEAGIAIDGSEIDAAQKKIDDCAKAIQGLDGDVKVAIGLEEDGSIDSIKKAFEEGKVKIDANTDPAVTKIEQLAENVERIEDKDVTINVTVNGLDQVKELNKQIDLATNIKGDIDKLSDYVENAKELNKLGNDITSYVTAEVKGNVIDIREGKLDNLKVFGESAKEVKGLGTFTSKVTADVEGNVIDTKEGKLDNLKVYTDSAKDIKEFKGDISSKITANIEGDVFDKNESTINNLEVFIDSAKGIKEIEGNIVSNITANTLGSVFTDKERNIDNLDVYIESAKGIKDIEGDIVSNITANVDGSVFTDSERTIDNLEVFVDSAKGIKDFEGDIVSNITANTLGSVFTDSERTTDNLKTFIESANGIKEIEGDIVSNITANTLGSVFTDKERSIDNLGVFIESAKGIKDIEGNIVSNITANTLGSVFTDKERTIDNLKIFTESAKGIKEIEGDIVSNITANTLGSVFTNPERETNNLKVFVESAKGIKDIEGDIVSNITANTLGSVFTDSERSIDNLKVFVDSAKGIKEIEGNISSSVTADVGGNVLKTTENKIDNLKVFADSAKDVKSVGSPTSNVTANVNGNVVNTSEDKIDNLGVFATNAKPLKGIGNFSSSVSANANGNVVEGEGASSRLSSLSEFQSIVSNMSSQTVSVSVTAKVDSENVNAAIDLLKKVSNSGVFKDYKATVQVGAKIATIDDTVVQNYKAPSKEGTVKYSVDPNSSVYTWTAPSKDGVVNYSASVEALTDAQKHKTGTITYKANIIGFGGVVNGTANVNGSAFANGTSGKAFKQGDWGVKKTTTALTGELGQELVVYKNRWYTVGDNGAEFATIPKGAIVFNHKQTEELFRNGKVTSDGGRGKAFANGTAFTSGTAFASGTDSFKESFDWIEVVISRLERAINNLEQTIDDTYKSWDSREDALSEKIIKLGDEITKQEEAKNYYSGKASSAYNDLSSYVSNLGYGNDYLTKITKGKINVQDVDDEKLAEKIKTYQEWYEKALDAEDAIIELRTDRMDSLAQYFDNTVSKYEGILEGFNHTESMIDEYIAQAEAKGHLVSGNYYKALIENNEENIIPTLIEQRDEMIAERNRLVAQGMSIDSEQYRDMSNEIDGVTQEIEAAKTQTLEWQNEIRNIDWQVFDLIQERISDVTEEANFLIDLMSYDKLFDDNGKLTDKGMATMGLHGQNYNVAMYQADEYGKEIAKLDSQIVEDPYDQELINRRQELIELQRESILNAEDEKQAIKDLISEGYEKELDALQERIDLHNEELDSMKDLYDYQKNVQEQTENIASLQKQLRAYEGFEDEETRATVQKLKLELEEANADLEETQYDKFIADQSALLDELYLEYENVLNARLDDTNGLITQVIDAVNIAASAEGTIATALGSEGAIASALGSNATTIKTTLETEAKNVGITLSTAMKGIWSVDEGNAKSVLTTYGTGFQNAQTTTNTVLGNIKSDINRMVDDVDKDAQKKIEQPKTQPAAKANPTGGSSGGSKPSSTGNKSTSGNGKVQIGDKVKFLSGKYYYDSQGVNPAGSKNHGKYVYITNVNNEKWATHPIHISTGKKLGSGDLGWLKKNQISGYATGKKNFLDNEIAWTQENGKEFIVRPSDGAILTPIAKGDSVLTSTASSNIWDMANSPAEFIKDNLNLGVANTPNNANVQNNITQNLDKVIFHLPNVKNYDELVSALQKDPKFDKLIKAITIDQIAGKSSLAKNKSIR